MLLKTRFILVKIFIINSLLVHTLIICQAQSENTVLSARTYLESYRYGEAIKIIDEQLVNDSSQVDLLLMKGKALAALGKYKPAAKALTTALGKDSSNVLILNELVNLYGIIGETDEGLRYAQRLFRQHPDNLFFKLQLARLYTAVKDFRRAIAILLPVYSEDTTDTYITKQIAGCYDELNRIDSAVLFFQKTLNLNKKDVGATGKLANIFIRMGNYGAGLYYTERFLEEDSLNAAILKVDGYLCYLYKAYPIATQRFSKCLALGDSSRFICKYQAMSYYRQEAFDKAVPFFRLAYEADTTDNEICFYYGVAATKSVLPDTGLIYLSKVLSRLKDSKKFISMVYAELAETYNYYNRSDTAIALLTKAREENPGKNGLLFKIAYEYDYYMRDFDKALVYYREFLKVAPPSEDVEDDSPTEVSYSDFAAKRVKEITKKRSGGR
ncbi:MAG: tetratricopeptide repeat protein [Bacteroidetes bacterium]|nr:tetratricopeptide repeat protein [Bacteroidota bacterium]